MDYDLYVQELIERRRRAGAPENVVVLPVVGSTNALARAIATEYQTEDIPIHPLLVLAFEQTEGRGRQGRTWSSPALMPANRASMKGSNSLSVKM